MKKYKKQYKNTAMLYTDGSQTVSCSSLESHGNHQGKLCENFVKISPPYIICSIVALRRSHMANGSVDSWITIMPLWRDKFLRMSENLRRGDGMNFAGVRVQSQCAPLVCLVLQAGLHKCHSEEQDHPRRS